MKYIIETEGLHCGHCDASVESALLKVAGVTGADSDHEAQTVEVEADGNISEDALKAAVESAGDFRALSVTAA
ncbi:MAG: heavy-metal-associated domain-containing protein [Coriobacteriaceae bacterium]|nr:heavy-metal-associated domain-containing protein [Coriobacteriaceae bacterium]